jgi:hypothetical protein
MTDHARAGYEAYGDHTGWKTFDGRGMPRWVELPERTQAAWKAGALGIAAELAKERDARDAAELSRRHARLARAVVLPLDARTEIERDLRRVQAQGATVQGQAATICALIESWRANAGLPRGVASEPAEPHGERCAAELRAMVARLDAFISRHGPITRDDMFEILMERADELAPQPAEPSGDVGQWGVRWPNSVWVAPLEEAEARSEAARHGGMLVQRASPDDHWSEVPG